jgi:hypothetical protein
MIEFPVFYNLDDRDGTRMASANDLSVGGLRLLGDEDFTNDTIIDFRFTLPNEAVAGLLIEKVVEERPALVTPQKSSSFGLSGLGKTEVDRASFGPEKKRVKVPPPPFKPMEMAGKIVIAFYNTRTNRFAHGVRFLHVPQKIQDEIERFIHLYQLKQLRDRAEKGV